MSYYDNDDYYIYLVLLVVCVPLLSAAAMKGLSFIPIFFVGNVNFKSEFLCS